MNQFDKAGLLCVRCDDIEWKPSMFATGLFVKDIAAAGGLEMQILRFEPGTRLPLHKYECPEFIYILEGELVVAGQRLHCGWASVASVGSIHANVHSDTGCLLVLVDRPLQELHKDSVAGP